MKIYHKAFSELDSTNRVLKDLAREGAPEGTLISAERQSAGRGRLGRSFFSPEGGLYLSLLLRPVEASFETTLITTSAAVAMARAIDDVCGDNSTLIKWVNDLYRAGKKVCGILAEGQCQKDQMAVILGVGVNISSPEGGFPEDIAQKAGALFDSLPAGKSLSMLRTELSERFLFHFVPLYEALPDASFLDDYRKRMFLISQKVYFEKNGTRHEALVSTVADDGALILKNDKSETLRLSAGEVSLEFEV